VSRGKSIIYRGRLKGKRGKGILIRGNSVRERLSTTERGEWDSDSWPGHLKKKTTPKKKKEIQKKKKK